jgi:uncharacterized protein (DUF2461 family)
VEAEAGDEAEPVSGIGGRGIALFGVNHWRAIVNGMRIARQVYVDDAARFRNIADKEAAEGHKTAAASLERTARQFDTQAVEANDIVLAIARYIGDE